MVAAEPVCLVTSLADAHLALRRGHGAHVPARSGQSCSVRPTLGTRRGRGDRGDCSVCRIHPGLVEQLRGPDSFAEVDRL